MDNRNSLHVEIFPHGGWWKDSRGRSGQVPQGQPRQTPLATIALFANALGQDGWTLTDVASQQHNAYRLTFVPAATAATATATTASDKGAPRRALICLG